MPTLFDGSGRVLQGLEGKTRLASGQQGHREESVFSWCPFLAYEIPNHMLAIKGRSVKLSSKGSKPGTSGHGNLNFL